jgi:hypothetical protein
MLCASSQKGMVIEITKASIKDFSFLLFSVSTSTFVYHSYCPVVLVLGPDEHLNIGKGRFHAFRKLGLKALAKDDCHSSLRKEILRNKKVKTKRGKIEFKNIVNFSIAWDWSFMGHTSEGINREMTSALECAFCNRNFVPPNSLLASPNFVCSNNVLRRVNLINPEDPQLHCKLL